MAIVERVAVHQTRLRVPGVGLDARGIAVGARGLVLLPSLDRLVAFLAVYSREQSLEPLMDELRIEICRSKLGAREVALGFTAASSDRLDRVAEVARVVGGFTFTGTTRHFVQYRDASAPFGYDALALTVSDAPLVLYHTSYSQVYEVERTLDLKQLLVSLAPHRERDESPPPARAFVVAEAGLGPSLAHYFSRSRVAAGVGIAEWPPASSFEEAPVRRYLFLVEGLPARMLPLLTRTPGIGVFEPSAPGVAIERGYRHPVTLRSCPVFDPDGLVLFRGGSPPLVFERLPLLAELASLQRAAVAIEPAAPLGGHVVGEVELRVPIRLVPSVGMVGGVAATFVPAAELGLLRRATYVLGRDHLRRLKIALTERGAFLTAEGGSEALPLGRFYRSYHPQVYVPSGLDVVPPVSPELLFSLLGSPQDALVFFDADGAAVGVPRAAFRALDEAVVTADAWAPLAPTDLEPVLTTETPTLWLEPLGVLPLRGAKPAP